MTPADVTRSALRRITLRKTRQDRSLRRLTAALAFATGLVVSPFIGAAALAHTTATSCTHGSVGVLHQQAYTVGTYAAGAHWHTVRLRHPFSSTNSYDGVRHHHGSGSCST